MNEEITSVTRSHQGTYHDSLEIHAGDPLEPGGCDPDWPGWRWAKRSDGRAGWVPETLLHSIGSGYVAARDYSGRELSVTVGEKVGIVEECLGWVWVRQMDGKEGWIPRDCLKVGSSKGFVKEPGEDPSGNA